jgi:photosystem II stability/assembly factor-like uncharacterized protein
MLGLTWILNSSSIFSTGISNPISGIACLPNSTTIIAIGTNGFGGLLSKSTDNGITWSSNVVYNGTFLWNIRFIDSNNGWLVGGTGAVYKTNDGGNTWSSINVSNAGSIKDIDFINSQVGYAYGESNIYKTSNGGAAWSIYRPVIDPSGANTGSHRLDFVSEDNGWYTYTPYSQIPSSSKSILTKLSTQQCSTIPAIIAPPQRPNAPTITPPTNSTICQGSNITLSATGCTGGTYSWTGGLTGSSVSVSPSVTRAYKVACTLNTCVSDSSSVVTINAIPKPAQPTITSTGNTVCHGTNVILTASTCLNGTYGWTGGLTTSSITISSVGTKSYKVACTVNGCTSDSSTVTTVQIKAKPSQPTITPPSSTTICQGAIVSLTASACVGGTLGWTYGLSGQMVSASPNNTKSYKVACTINGCTSDSSNVVTIIVNPTPVISVSANKTSVCLSDTAILTVTGCTGSISWSNGATTSAIKVSPATNTTYTATCTLGSCSANQSVSITALSTPNVTASGILQCGQTVTLTANNVPVGASIQWRKDGVDIAGATNSTLVINSSGSYDFRVGNIFSTQASVNSGSTSDLHFINENIGFHVLNGAIRKTTDGGITWTNVYTLSSISDIFFVDANYGWAITNSQQIIRTTDGGSTWLTYGGNLSSIRILARISFKDVNNGVIATSENKILYTNDGGVTWSLSSGQIFTNSLSTWIEDIEYVKNTSTIIVVGYDANTTLPAIIKKSIDNGNSWTLVKSLNIGSFYDVQFINSTTGWAVGDNGTVVKTIDGGNTWNTSNDPNIGPVRNVDFVNEQIGYVFGEESIFKTINGGVSWSPFRNVRIIDNQTIGFVTLKKLDFVSEDIGWYSYQTIFDSPNKAVLKKSSTPQCSTIPKAMTNICCSTFETIKSGSWTDPTTWSCNRVPISTDDVIINTGHTITNSGGTIRAKSLNYRGGQLQLSPTSNLILGN